MAQKTVASGLTSRRAVLKSGAALAGGGLCAIGDAAADPSETVSVLTQNLFFGAALAPVLEAETEAEFERTAGRIYRDVLESRFDLRARALAEEIAGVEPDVIGLQEVARFAERGGESNTRDYLQLLVEELEAEGLSYDEAASVKTFDAEFSVTGTSTPDRVRFSNRDVILAREGVETSGADAGTYYAGGMEFGIGRGYCSATVADAFTFVNTHLSTPRVPVLQLLQAAELSARFRDPPTVLVGDFNSGPDTSAGQAYDVLTRRYTDAYAEANPDADGYTCCQRPTLTNEESTLDRRIDHVFTRGDVEPLGAERIGDDRTARVEGRWPSDHAGVTAELELP
jgi:endonuclease/exonuclease/phosphatase family metal-dependent hydrolase